MGGFHAPGLLLGLMDGGELEQRVLRLMDRRLPWARSRRMIAAAGCAVVMASLCTGGMLVAVRAQERSLKFEVVSLRPVKGESMAVAYGPSATGYRASNVPLVRVILAAYLTQPNPVVSLPVDRVKNAPAWVMNEPYDILAKLDDAGLEAMKGKTTAEQQAFVAPMLRAMLQDRFKLTVHTTPTEVQGYALVVSKRGTKVREVSTDEPLPERGLTFGGTWKYLSVMTDGKQTGSRYAQITMPELAGFLGSGPTPVLDQTGLKGKYDFELPLMATDSTGGEGSATPAPRPDVAHRYDWGAIGLEMKPIKVPVPFVVVDHIERPTEN